MRKFSFWVVSLGCILAPLILGFYYLPPMPEKFYLEEGSPRWSVKATSEETNSIGQWVFPGDTCQIDPPGELTIWLSEKPMLKGRFHAKYMSRESMDPPLCPSSQVTFIIPREFFENWRQEKEENNARLQKYFARAREEAAERWANDPDRERY